MAFERLFTMSEKRLVIIDTIYPLNLKDRALIPDCRMTFFCNGNRLLPEGLMQMQNHFHRHFTHWLSGRLLACRDDQRSNRDLHKATSTVSQCMAWDGAIRRRRAADQWRHVENLLQNYWLQCDSVAMKLLRMVEPEGTRNRISTCPASARCFRPQAAIFLQFILHLDRWQLAVCVEWHVFLPSQTRQKKVRDLRGGGLNPYGMGG